MKGTLFADVDDALDAARDADLADMWDFALSQASPDDVPPDGVAEDDYDDRQHEVWDRVRDELHDELAVALQEARRNVRRMLRAGTPGAKGAAALLLVLAARLRDGRSLDCDLVRAVTELAVAAGGWYWSLAPSEPAPGWDSHVAALIRDAAGAAHSREQDRRAFLDALAARRSSADRRTALLSRFRLGLDDPVPEHHPPPLVRLAPSVEPNGPNPRTRSDVTSPEVAPAEALAA